MKMVISCCVFALMVATISSFPYRLPEVVFSPLTLQQTMLYKALDRDLPRVVPVQQYAILQNMLGNTARSGAAAKATTVTSGKKNTAIVAGTVGNTLQSGADAKATTVTSGKKNTAIVAGTVGNTPQSGSDAKATTVTSGKKNTAIVASDANTGLNVNSLQNARTMYGGARGINTGINMNTLQQARMLYGGDLPDAMNPTDIYDVDMPYYG